ncbi:MAG: hypothetical protein ABSF70_14265 [Terracidiphilus sp.]|jgi:hypothetical protein
MYCAACGSTLPIEALFCPRCGKRSILDEVTPDTALPETPTNTGIDTKDNGKMLEPEPSPQSEANPAPPASETNTTTNAVAQAFGANTSEQNSTVANKFRNAGSITLAVVALICLILGAVQGFIPIFLIEGVAFGALAWLCAARWPLSPRIFSAVFVTSLLLAGLVGVTLDQDTFGPRYRYLSQNSTQYRIDEKAGRTDKLGSGGWHPVAFDKDAQELPVVVNLDKGEWSRSFGDGSGRICFTTGTNATNPFAEVNYGNGDTKSSDYIIDRISIAVEIHNMTSASAEAYGSSHPKEDHFTRYISGGQVVLKNDGGGFINSEETTKVCGSTPRDLADGETWSYTDMHVYGWKR